MEKLYFEWDTVIWGKALPMWRKVLNSKNNETALDLGARRGGMALFLAKEYSIKVLCTDLENPEPIAKVLHTQQECSKFIEYESMDCTNISLPDESLDIVIFKSLLGDLRTQENQMLAISEMYRVLKPGGVLLFAENLEASPIHMFFRRNFIKWASFWRYVKYDEINEHLKIFSSYNIQTNGFLTTFLSYKYRDNFAYLDNLIIPVIPRRWRYVCFGYAVK